MDIFFRIAILIFLLILSAFFSSAETAFNCANEIRLKNLSEEGNKRAKAVLKILENYSKLISGILIGNNLVNIVASSLTTTLALLSGYSFAVSLATGLLTIVVLLCGEIIPKNWAKAKADKIVLLYAYFFKIYLFLFTPVIFLFDKTALILMKILRINTKEDAPSITEGELRTILDTSHEDGVIEEKEKDMIINLFDLSESKARDIMIPRIDMVMVSEKASYREIMNVFRENMYTRLPVYSERKENVIGIINMKDFLFIKNPDTFKIENFLREPYYTYEYKNTSDLLAQMRLSSNNIAIVLNEYGDAEGMITLEDLLEEIVGEIRDEYDTDEEELIEKVNDREYIVQGNLKLDDINDALDTEFESEDYDSIGGLMIDNLDRLPKEGESVELENNTKLTALKVARNRILSVKILLPEKEEENEEDKEEESR
ncbi:MAG: HlyC/CorC family transporter [Lachnospiraceae bacterium]|nr:HlyC/CorC family transporter [Lachnospiraceae bacterium]